MNMSMQEYLEAQARRYDQLEDFAKYVANAVMREDFSDETFAELFCRRLYKLGYICKIDDQWALINAVEEFPADDVAQVVYCKDCKHAPEPGGSGDGIDVRFPDDACPFNCPDHWYNVRPAPEFFCANGERREGGTP